MNNISTETTKQQVEVISNGIAAEFIDDFLVKPLEPIMVKKEFSKPVTTNVVKDDNGIEASDYDKVETEIKEVESDFRKGVVLKTPLSYQNQIKDPNVTTNVLVNIEPGDTVIFKDRHSNYYDLFKDSKLVKYYNITAVEKC